MGNSYRQLIVWQKAIRLVAEVYKQTESFPREEFYGLRNQIRRASVSVPSNIAEGQARFSHKEFCHFLNNARGSLAEVETQISIAQTLGFLKIGVAERLLAMAEELGKILNGLLASVRARCS